MFVRICTSALCARFSISSLITQLQTLPAEDSCDTFSTLYSFSLYPIFASALMVAQRIVGVPLP